MRKEVLFRCNGATKECGGCEHATVHKKMDDCSEMSCYKHGEIYKISACVPTDWHGKTMEEIRKKIEEVRKQWIPAWNKAESREEEAFLDALCYLKVADWLAGKENKQC